MKRIINVLLVIAMIITTVSPSIAGTKYNNTNSNGNMDGGIKPLNILPVEGTYVYEYRFYKSEQDAMDAISNPAVQTVSVQRINEDGKLIEPQIIEKKDYEFLGWFYKDGASEKKVDFVNGEYVDSNKTFYIYPKYKEKKVIIFSVNNMVTKTIVVDSVLVYMKESQAQSDRNDRN